MFCYSNPTLSEYKCLIIDLNLFILLHSALLMSQNQVTLAVLKYNGGGDYYANPTALPNLIEFCNATLQTEINSDEVPYVEAGSKDLFDYPFVHMNF